MSGHDNRHTIFTWIVSVNSCWVCSFVSFYGWPFNRLSERSLRWEGTSYVYGESRSSVEETDPSPSVLLVDFINFKRISFSMESYPKTCIKFRYYPGVSVDCIELFIYSVNLILPLM